ncbi:AEC family transporter [Carnimonas bestiolae]|uniref:AEC family transporter n=1 Tax=Carnimonas bestiolae TaxID=3402172 RepID=UPI003EDC8756
MFSTIIGALLPVVITLALGFVAGWHQDFDSKQAAVLNRMVMLYALPLSLFAGMVQTSRAELMASMSLFALIGVAMVAGYIVMYGISRYLFKRSMSCAALQALAIAGPAVPFIGSSVLGFMFNNESAMPIAVGGILMNIFQVPVTLVLLSLDAQSNAQPDGAPSQRATEILLRHVLTSLKEPVIWAPLLALAFILLGISLPSALNSSFELLGRATGGVALFASGIILFSQKVMLNAAVTVSVVARNLIIPLGIWLLARSVGADATTISEAVLTVAIPSASICVILAVQYQVAEREMASTLFLSTIGSVVTMGGFIVALPG